MLFGALHYILLFYLAARLLCHKACRHERTSRPRTRNTTKF